MTDTTANDEFVGGKDSGYSGFLYFDDNGIPLVAMHWVHRFNHMVHRYNEIYRVQITNITPHGDYQRSYKNGKKTDLKLYLKMEANCQKTVFVRFL